MRGAALGGAAVQSPGPEEENAAPEERQGCRSRDAELRGEEACLGLVWPQTAQRPLGQAPQGTASLGSQEPTLSVLQRCELPNGQLSRCLREDVADVEMGAR